MKKLRMIKNLRKIFCIRVTRKAGHVLAFFIVILIYEFFLIIL